MRFSVLSVPAFCCALLAIGCGHSGPGAAGGLTGTGGGATVDNVLDSYPHDGSSGVSSASDVLVEFGSPMNKSTVQVTVTPPLPGFSPYPLWDGNFMELSRGLSGAMAGSTRYSVAITGKTLAGDTLSHAFSFTTAPVVSSTVAPALASSVPASGAAGVNPLSHVVFHFSEPMRFSTFDPDPELGAMTWNAAGDTLDYAPPPNGFLAGSSPSVSLQGQDLAWNSLPGTQVSFTVPEVAVPLQVLGMSPPPGSTGVPLTAPVSLSFSRDMEPVSTAAAITVSPGSGCSASSQWINPRMYRCLPATQAAGTQITVAVGTGARDAGGNALPAAWSSSFTVASTNDTTAPTIVSSTPGPTAAVANGTPVVINFSKTMDRGTAESRFRMLLNGVSGHFQWNAASTQLTFTPTAVYYPGFTVQWTADFSEDLSGNTVYEFPTVHEFHAIGVGHQDLTVPSTQAVTMGTLGSRASALGMLLIGDDSRDQGTDAFLSFDLSALPVASPAAAVRQAYLILPRMGCEGSVANLGGTLLVEEISTGASIGAADLGSTAVGTPVQVQNVCAGPAEIFVPVTEKIRADFAAAKTLGATTHFRLRFAQATNGDHLPDRLVLEWRQLLEEPRLRVVYEIY